MMRVWKGIEAREGRGITKKAFWGGAYKETGDAQPPAGGSPKEP